MCHKTPPNTRGMYHLVTTSRPLFNLLTPQSDVTQNEFTGRYLHLKEVLLGDFRYLSLCDTCGLDSNYSTFRLIFTPPILGQG